MHGGDNKEVLQTYSRHKIKQSECRTGTDVLYKTPSVNTVRRLRYVGKI